MSMYNLTRGKGSLSLAGSVTSGAYITSPATGEKILLKEVIIQSEEIWEIVYKSKYNSRNRNLLTPATVMAILPSIRDAGRNTLPVLAVKGDDGKYEVLSGMKRSFAVSISPGTSLVVHYAENMSEEDKQSLAKTADLHEKPSFLDVALSIKDYKNEVGDKFTVRSAATIFDVSKSSISDLMKFADLPVELFRLFPGASFVTWRFLKKISDSNKTDEEIIAATKMVDGITSEVDKVLSENATDDFKRECKVLEEKLLALLFKKADKTKQTKSFSDDSPFYNSKLVAGVIAKKEAKGAISLKLEKSFIESDAGREIIKLLSKS